MKKILFGIILSTIALIAFLYHSGNISKKDINQIKNIEIEAGISWLEWKNKNSKKYHSKEEESKKFKIFFENYKKIKNHSSKKNKSYTVNNY